MESRIGMGMDHMPELSAKVRVKDLVKSRRPSEAPNLIFGGKVKTFLPFWTNEVRDLTII